MRKTIALAVVAACATIAGYASAAVLVNETFPYPNGNLQGNGGWAQLSTDIGTTDIQVLSNRAEGSSSTNPDDHKTFAPQALTATTYAAFKVRIADPGAGLPKPVHFAGLTDGVLVPGPAIVSRLFVLPITGGWTFGISHGNSANPPGVAAWSSVLAATLTYGTDYTVVTNYDPVATTSKLWVNPVNEASASITVTDAATAAIAVASVSLRQSASASTIGNSYPLQAAGTLNFNWSVDGVGVGTTFADAVAGSTPVELSKFAVE